ncbi:MAG: LytTR family DNA-binding domain-containing protein [Pseudomonadota bacterium]
MGTMAKGSGTNGGRGGTGGAQRRLALVLGGGFAAIVLVVMIANAESTLSDFAALGRPETKAHVWLWEITSIIAWISIMPAIWWMVARVRPPRFPWWAVALIVALASIPASLWHVALMVGMRKAVYAANGETYRFFSAIDNKLLYEYRKDFAAYLQFAGLAAIAQWLLARAAVAVPDTGPRILQVSDGGVVHRVPVAEIESAVAAGNYVEIDWGGRKLLHRSTLAALAEQLGADFAQIHRGRLVRRDAVRSVETDRSGDFTVTLAGGETLRGSRRFRDGL